MIVWGDGGEFDDETRPPPPHRHRPEKLVSRVMEGGGTQLEVWKCGCGAEMEFRSSLPTLEE